MGMYEDRLPIDAQRETTDLQQGDILAGVLLPESITGQSFNVHKGSSYGQATAAELAAAEATAVQKIKLITSVRRHPFVIVVSSTCDNFQTASVLIAPIVAYEFDEDADSDAKKWRQISVDATGIGSAKLFYLAGNPSASFERSHAVLNRIMPASHKYLTRCFNESGARRVCGLTPASQRHLQYALSLMFSRNAREDSEWPSIEDFRLKAASLREAIPSAGKKKSRYEAELREIERILSVAETAGTSTDVDPLRDAT